ncbi:hypothetical protein O6H91_02G108900 [Diphasiastrum complanatum]|uniref:Uncharacterized protein n=1 Tax=Diphasiastrum complanatum TaxID=34168 RepID=A0ACC2EJ85_DIPCM|nr:hypothetical protein O6H91_02G108900 [Diphasiastrum complanatum]
MMAAQQHTSLLHVVLFAFPLKGHIQPALNLAERLHHEGVSITFVSAQHQISTIQRGYSNEHTGFQLVGFSEEEPRPPNFQPDSVAGIGWARRSAYRMRNSFEKLIAELVSLAKSPICIVSDDFLSWALEVAEQFHLRWYAFHPSSASFLALQLYLPTILSDYRRLSSSHYHDDAVTHFIDSDEPICIPGIGCLEVDDLPLYLQNNSPMVTHNAAVEITNYMHRADGVLVNTHEELEKKALQALRTNSKLNPNMVEIFPIGPCSPISDHTSDNRYASKPEVQEAINWLNDQQASSVLYVCFGSLFIPSLSQIEELALGLEASGHPFFWVLRSPISNESESYDISQILPPQFLARTRKQGKIFTGWAPQLQILSQSSVGGFLSHCGWNSTIESTAMGIPILAFPQMADQMINAKLLSEDLRSGAVLLGNGYKGLVERGEIDRAVRKFMQRHDEEGKRIRSELQIATRSAIAEGGVSQKYLQTFIQSAKSKYEI